MDFQVDPIMRQRIDVLAERANEGSLTAEERDEYEDLINTSDDVAVLKLKARTAS